MPRNNNFLALENARKVVFSAEIKQIQQEGNATLSLSAL
jgi:hypothetical protein